MNKKLIVFDMDGTIYLGDKLIDGALETFEYLNEKKIDYVFFTNNSSHDLEYYENKISSFGIKCDLKKNFCSSTEVTISYLRELGVKKIFVLGNESLKNKLRNEFEVVEKYSALEKIEAVVAGFYTELVYESLQDACLYLQTLDIPFIATNGDYRCPIGNDLYIPDCGGMIEWMRLCTGKRAEVMGKPNPKVIDYLIKSYKVNKEDILLVGDRLYTDILTGVNSMIDTICVLSGEASMEDIKASPYKPTYVLDSIKSMRDLLK